MSGSGVGDPSQYGLPAIPGSGSGSGSGSGVAASGKKVPIGVPKGYEVTTQAPGSMMEPWGVHNPSVTHDVTQGARYFKGDGWKLMPTNPQDTRLLQQGMVQTGLLDPHGVVYGVWDGKSATAFEKLLATANGSGVEWKDALQARLASTAQGDLQTKQKTIPPLTIKLTNPEDIKAVVQNTAKTLTGGVWNDADVNNMVTQYQAQERAVQTQEYNQKYNPNADMGVSGGVHMVGGYGAGGETVQAPTAGRGLDQQVHDSLIAAHPADAAVATFSNNLGNIMSSMGWGTASGAGR